MSDFNEKYEYFLTYDIPIPYNNLLIKQAIVRDYFSFFGAIRCFMLEKNKITDPKIISMSYLDFLFHLYETDESFSYIGVSLDFLLSKCLSILKYDDEGNETLSEIHKIEYKKDEKNKVILFLNSEIEINKKDFDIIKEIIIKQNVLNYSDEYIHPDLKTALDEVDRIQNMDCENPPLEKQIIAVSKNSCYKIEDVYDLSIRKFMLYLSLIDAQMHYQIYKTGEAGGQVKFKEPIQHWLYAKKKNFADGKLVSYEGFKKKLEHVV